MKLYHITKEKISSRIGRMSPSKKLFNLNARVILLAALIFFGFTLFQNIYFAAVPAYFLSRFIIYIAVALLIAMMASLLIGIVNKFSWFFRAAVFFTVISGLYFYPGLTNIFSWLLIGMLIIFPGLLVSGVYLWRKAAGKKSRKRKALGISLACLGFLGIISFVYSIFIFEGKAPHVRSNVKMMGTLPPLINAPNPATGGNLSVTRSSYGSGNDKHRAYFGSEATMKTQTVDASGILKSWDGFFGRVRSHFFGFDAKELPLNALVWHPVNIEEPVPLVLLVHGNHLAEDFSEGGYAYLAEHLAGKGYIVASVDENFLNISAAEKNEHLKNENATRGWLLLQHLQLWRDWNKDPSSNFYQKVAMDKIALIGHSRGGEAIGHAALFNKLPYNPDDATQVFDFNFNIKSLIAIAPVDGQYKPGKKLTELRDVNYFVLQGAQDMDMKSYGGLATYHRIKFSENFKGFKAGLYIKGANHGQFNSVWGRHDQHLPAMYQYNVKQLMHEQKQQEIAKVYISAFLDVTLKEKENYKPLFMDYRYGREWLPKNSYFNQFEQNGTTYICTFEEDLNVQSTTLAGGSIKAVNLSAWHEQQHTLVWNGSLTNAVYIGWDRNTPGEKPSYAITLPDSLNLDVSNSFLTFTLAQGNENPTKNKRDNSQINEEENARGIDFKIRLEDRNGEIIDFSLGNCSLLQPPIQRNLAKFSFLEQDAKSESIPDFFYFDMVNLSKKNTSFQRNELKSISFVFDKTPSGTVILDKVGFMKF